MNGLTIEKAEETGFIAILKDGETVHLIPEELFGVAGHGYWVQPGTPDFGDSNG